jgi:amino acid transporter
LSPVFSIYGVGSDVLQHAGTGAAGLFLLGIGVAAIWAVVYAELGSAFPYAGGDYVGVGAVLGPAAGFVSLTLWAVTVIPVAAFLAKVVAVYVVDLAPAVPTQFITFGSLAAAIFVALLAVRTSAVVTGLFIAVEMLAVLALIVAGTWSPARSLMDVIAHPVAGEPRVAIRPLLSVRSLPIRTDAWAG